VRERAAKAAPRFDRRADDHELRAALRSEPCDVLAEAAGPGADDLAPHSNAVRACDGCCGLETILQGGERTVHVRVERQLALDDERRNEDDPSAAIGRQPTGEIEGVLRLLPVEQRHDDAPVGDRAGPVREAARSATQRADVGQPHRISW
jgi:hypothetical protein